MKKIVSFLVSLIIILLIYSRIDLEGMISALAKVDLFFLTGCFLLFIPQILLNGYRWKLICAPYYKAGMEESLSLVLSGQAMNLVLPSKMGDIAKAAFLHDHTALDWRKGLDFVILEKGLDFASLALWMVLAFLVRPVGGSLELMIFLLGLAVILMVALVYSGFLGEGERIEKGLGKIHGRLGEWAGSLLKGAVDLKKDLSEIKVMKKVVLISILVWVLHLGQFYLFFLSLGLKHISLITVFALIPMGIFIGLLPLTISGIGTRDAALIYLFKAWVTPEKMVLVGVFSLVRYLVPGLLGLPFVGKRLTSLRLNSKKVETF